MQIVADENIPLVNEAFTNFGTVRTVVGRDLNRNDLGEAEILLVRSVTQINKKLLAGSAVRFVGTATIGLDHIDLNYLHQQNIGFASAQGSNATAVAEYVISGLLIIAERQGFQLQNKTVGIIGCGNVGSRVLNKLKALGVKCVIYDPPLQEKIGNSKIPPNSFFSQKETHKGLKKGEISKKNEGSIHYVNLDTVLSADIITLHVPLSTTGRYPTYHLVNADFLAKLRDDIILVNTSRGAVVDEKALLEKLSVHPLMTVILDVWDNEPHINLSLLQRAALCTPHIAGYSLDGKVRGTEMLYAAVCDYFQQFPSWQAHHYLPSPPLTRLSFSKIVDDYTAIHTAVMACYDVRRDDAALRQLNQAVNRDTYFDNLRKHYPVRREFACIEIEVPQKKSVLATRLRELGFRVL